MSLAFTGGEKSPSGFGEEVAARLFKGIVLAPVGAAVGVLIVMLRLPPTFPRAAVFVLGAMFGTLSAAPLTCVVLPLARGPHRWGGVPALAWLVAVGAVLGPPLTVTVTAVIEAGRTGGNITQFTHSAWVGGPNPIPRLLVLAASGAGAVCGLLFFLWTRPRSAICAE